MSESPSSTRVRPDGENAAANDARTLAPTPTRAPAPAAAAVPVSGQPARPATHIGKLWPATTVTAVEAAEEATYWRDHYRSRPYAGPGANHDDFGPAYAYALNAYGQHAGKPFDRLAPLLAAEWPAHRGRSCLDWAQACPAVRDAWERLHAR